MEKYEFEGRTYIYARGKWLNADYTKVSLDVIQKLNVLITNDEKLDNMSYAELLAIGKRAKEGGNYQLAKKAIRNALGKAESNDERRHTLPIMTSLLRESGFCQDAIELADEYIRNYGQTVASAALYTSLGGAYADLEKYDKARECANKARAKSGENGSIELQSLYCRLNRDTK